VLRLIEDVIYPTTTTTTTIATTYFPATHPTRGIEILGKNNEKSGG
jgi:hypothetical protein